MIRFFISIGLVAVSFIVFQFWESPEPTPPTREAGTAPVAESMSTTTDVVATSIEQSTSSTTTVPEIAEVTEQPVEPTPVATLPTYTKETLAQYNGENPNLPIYIAFEGSVYDVTDGRKFYEPGGSYHFLAGTDGTLLLRTFGGDLVKQKYPVVGIYLD